MDSSSYDVCILSIAHRVGDARIFARQGASLVSAGKRVCALIPSSNPDEQSCYGVHILPFKLASRNPLLRVLAARRACRNAATLGAKRYILHDVELLPHTPLLLATGAKVIFDSHEDWPTYATTIAWLPKPLGLLARWMLQRLYASRLPRLNAVWTVSPNLIGRLSPYNRNVSLVPNYPRLRPLPPLEPLREDVALRVVYVGSLYEPQVHLRVLQALAQAGLPGATYTIVDDVPEPFLAAVNKSGTDALFRHIHRQRPDDLPALLSTFHVGIALFDDVRRLDPPRGSLGVNKLYDYMSASVAILANPLDLWRDLIARWRCGLCVEPNDVDGLATLFARLGQSLPACQKMGANGRRAVEKCFNWDAYQASFVNTCET